MFWVIAVIAVAIIAACLDSTAGKVAVGAGVVALGLLLLSWITGFDFLITLAKICVVVIVLIIVGVVLLSIIGS